MHCTTMLAQIELFLLLQNRLASGFPSISRLMYGLQLNRKLPRHELSQDNFRLHGKIICLINSFLLSERLNSALCMEIFRRQRTGGKWPSYKFEILYQPGPSHGPLPASLIDNQIGHIRECNYSLENK